MAGVIGEPVEPSPSYRPGPCTLPGQGLASSFSQSEAALFFPPMACAVAWDLWLRQSSSAMSCRRWHARVQAFFVTRRSSAPLHDLL